MDNIKSLETKGDNTEIVCQSVYGEARNAGDISYALSCREMCFTGARTVAKRYFKHHTSNSEKDRHHRHRRRTRRLIWAAPPRETPIVISWASFKSKAPPLDEA